LAEERHSKWAATSGGELEINAIGATPISTG
jgi:hypothetical protein